MKKYLFLCVMCLWAHFAFGQAYLGQYKYFRVRNTDSTNRTSLAQFDRIQGYTALAIGTPPFAGPGGVAPADVYFNVAKTRIDGKLAFAYDYYGSQGRVVSCCTASGGPEWQFVQWQYVFGKPTFDAGWIYRGQGTDVMTQSGLYWNSATSRLSVNNGTTGEQTLDVLGNAKFGQRLYLSPIDNDGTYYRSFMIGTGYYNSGALNFTVPYRFGTNALNSIGGDPFGVSIFSDAGGGTSDRTLTRAQMEATKRFTVGNDGKIYFINYTTPGFIKASATGELTVDTNIYLTSSTGVSSITGTSNQVIVSANTGAVTLSLPQSIATTSSVNFNALRINGLTTNGVLLTSSANGTVTVSSTLGVGNGGTGRSSLATGSLLLGTASTSMNELIAVASGNVLLSNGVNANPVYGQITNAHVSATANIDATKLGTGAVNNTELNYISSATGTTGTATTNLVFSASPTLTGTLTAANITASGTMITSNYTGYIFSNGGSGWSSSSTVPVGNLSGFYPLLNNKISKDSLSLSFNTSTGVVGLIGINGGSAFNLNTWSTNPFYAKQASNNYFRSTNNFYSAVNFVDSTSGSYYQRYRALVSNVGGVGALSFSYSNNGGVYSADVLTIKGTSVGIGNNNPAVRLDVSGDIKFTGTLNSTLSAGYAKVDGAGQFGTSATIPMTDITGNLAFTRISGGSVGRIPYFDAGGLLTSNAGLGFASSTYGLTLFPTNIYASGVTEGNIFEYDEQFSDPTAPVGGGVKLYAKSQSLYMRNQGGSVLRMLNSGDVIGISQGGNNITSYTTGDMLYASATNVLSKRPIGSTGQYLKVVGGVPTWTSFAGSDIPLTQDRIAFGSASNTITSDAGLRFVVGTQMAYMPNVTVNSKLYLSEWDSFGGVATFGAGGEVMGTTSIPKNYITATNNQIFTGSGGVAAQDADLTFNPSTNEMLLFGRMQIGTAGILTSTNLNLTANISGNAISRVVKVGGAIQSGVTTRGTGIEFQMSTASGLALPTAVNIHLLGTTEGSSSVLTTEYGILAEHFSDATSGISFQSNQTAATGSYAFFGNGTAINRFNGNTGIGADPTYPLHITVSNSSPIFGMTRTSVGTFTNSISGAMTNSAADLTFDGGQASSGFIFRTRNSSNSSINALGIDRDGNVGIGTTSPTRDLHVSGTGIQQIGITSTDGNPVQFVGNGTYTQLISSTAPLYLSTTGTNPLYFQTNALTRGHIDGTTGNLGIGATSGATHTITAINADTVTYAGTTNSGNGMYIYNNNTANNAGKYTQLKFQVSSNGVQNALGFLSLVQEAPASNNSIFTFKLRNTIGNYGEIMRMEGQTGNVSIGQTTTANYKLDVNGPIATNGYVNGSGAYYIKYSANAASRSWRIASDLTSYGALDIQQSTTQTGGTYATKLYIAANGNIGVGTNPSPQSMLHLQGATGTSVITLQRTPYVAGSPLGDLGYMNSANNYVAGIKAVHAVDSTNADLILMAGGASSNAYANTERIKILGSNGNVGIGVGTSVTPASLLHLYNGSTTNSIALLTIEANAAGGLPYINFKRTGTNSGYVGHGSTGNDFFHVYNSLNSDLLFGTNNTEKMRILANGNIGIGTTAPNAPLQLSNTLANRKIVINEGANNDHQYYGFGVNTSILRYQVAGTTGDHVFYAATSSSASNELARITGTGNLSIANTLTGLYASLTDSTNTGKSKFTSFQNSTSNSRYGFFNTTNSFGSYMEFKQNGVVYGNLGNGSNIYASGTNSDIILGSSTGKVHLGTNSLLRLTVTNAGLVGILNVSPSYTLDVGGTFRNLTSAYLATQSGAAAVGTTTIDASAKFQIESTTSGFLMPRLTTTQRNAVSSPANGLQVYDSDLSDVFVYAGAWKQMSSYKSVTTHTYDAPSLANGAEQQTTVTVTGAALGDDVRVSVGLDWAGLDIWAYVSATNTVTIRFRNGTGGAVDLASATYTIRRQ